MSRPRRWPMSTRHYFPTRVGTRPVRGHLAPVGASLRCDEKHIGRKWALPVYCSPACRNWAWRRSRQSRQARRQRRGAGGVASADGHYFGRNSSKFFQSGSASPADSEAEPLTRTDRSANNCWSSGLILSNVAPRSAAAWPARVMSIVYGPITRRGARGPLSGGQLKLLFRFQGISLCQGCNHRNALIRPGLL